MAFDPFTGIELPEPKAETDIVLCSHSHGDHNNAKAVLKKGGTTLEGFVGSKEVQGIAVNDIATLHDAAGGSQRGKNSVYTVQLDGLVFCHLGDLGHDITAEQAAAIGNIDVLFTLVSGGATIGPDVASSVVKRLNPRIVVPMHYNPGVAGTSPWFPNAMPVGVEEFLEGKKNVERAKGRSFEVTKENLPKEQKIIMLKL